MRTSLEEHLSSSQWELSYGKVRLQPAIFQDDIGRMVSSLEAAKAGNILLSSLLETKLLSFNTEKSVVLAIGKCSKSNELREELRKNP